MQLISLQQVALIMSILMRCQYRFRNRYSNCVYAGDALTFAESFTTGTSSNYNSSLACTGATDTNLADGLTINAADSNIVCTYTNTRKSTTFRLAKVWSANSTAGNVASIGATTGLTNNTALFTSTASTNTNSATVTVFAGESFFA